MCRKSGLREGGGPVSGPASLGECLLVRGFVVGGGAPRRALREDEAALNDGDLLGAGVASDVDVDLAAEIGDLTLPVVGCRGVEKALQEGLSGVDYVLFLPIILARLPALGSRSLARMRPASRWAATTTLATAAKSAMRSGS